MTGPGDELVEVVDEDGAVVDVVRRAEMRAGNLRHRAVFVVVVDGGRILVHQRAAWKDVFPSAWDLAFGGVLGVGEDWREAARRELAEEAGITLSDARGLQRLGAGAYEDERVRLVAEVFSVRATGPFSFDDGEVVAVEWVELAELEGWVAGRQVVPDSVAIVLPLLDGRPTG